MALMLAKEQSKAKSEGPAGWEAPGTRGPALPSPACVQNGTNPGAHPWTRERSGTAARLTDVHGQPQSCASRQVCRSRQPHVRPTCLAPRPCTEAPATKSRFFCRVERASLFGGRSLAGRGSSTGQRSSSVTGLMFRDARDRHPPSRSWSCYASVASCRD